MRILSKVSYSENEHRAFPDVFPNAYDIRSVLLNVRDVYISQALASVLERNPMTKLYIQRLPEDSLSDFDDYSLERRFLVSYNGLTLCLSGHQNSETFYVSDVLFNGKSVKNPTNMRSAYLYLDVELTHIGQTYEKLAPTF